jgi:hypothetical protein
MAGVKGKLSFGKKNYVTVAFDMMNDSDDLCGTAC